MSRRQVSKVRNSARLNRVLVIAPSTCGKTTLLNAVNDGYHHVVEDDVFYALTERWNYVPKHIWDAYALRLFEQGGARVTLVHPHPMWSEDSFLNNHPSTIIVLFNPVRNAQDLAGRWKLQRRSLDYTPSQLIDLAERELYMMREIKRARKQAIRCRDFAEVDSMTELLAAYSCCAGVDFRRLVDNVTTVVRETEVKVDDYARKSGFIGEV
jgi:energy-coupling factor transporter ATP-binding protein EcfA2